MNKILEGQAITHTKLSEIRVMLARIEQILNSKSESGVGTDIKNATALWRRYEATLQREGHLIPRGGFPAFLKMLDKEDV